MFDIARYKILFAKMNTLKKSLKLSGQPINLINLINTIPQLYDS